VLSWDAALVVEPAPADQDVEFLLEFANAQLLELRVYDAYLDNCTIAPPSPGADRPRCWSAGSRTCSRTARGNVLEVIIILLIVTEVILGLVRH
jgi:hypothetical protein